MGFEDAPDPADARLRKLVHDLRTPLTIVQGFADLLQQKEDISPEQRKEFLERISAAARDLRDLLDAEREQRLEIDESLGTDAATE